MTSRPLSFLLAAAPLLLSASLSADETTKITGNDQGIYEQSIKSTKKSIDREMIDTLYRDAIDAYHDNRYDEALELLDKIYMLDPTYEDVAKLRTIIRKSQAEKAAEATMDTVKGYMRQGEQAFTAGQNVAAINFWKQALDVYPAYAPAQQRIREVNQALARKEFESGYIHYRHGELEDAQEAWSNAIALDPTYKQRGLLLLMSKVQIQVQKDQITRLSSQGFDQYQQGNEDAALQSYEELLKIEPRNEEARRMSAKIKVQIGQSALKDAQTAFAGHDYPKAIEGADKAVLYSYEIATAQTIKSDSEKAIKLAAMPKPPKPKPRPVVVVSTPTAPTEPPVAAKPRNPEEAMIHYRKGLAAIRTKDYHLALEELDIATQLDPANEHIYIARQRAQQEWSSSNPDAAPKS